LFVLKLKQHMPLY